MKVSSRKKLLAMLLTVSLVLTTVPISFFATDTSPDEAPAENAIASSEQSQDDTQEGDTQEGDPGDTDSLPDTSQQEPSNQTPLASPDPIDNAGNGWINTNYTDEDVMGVYSSLRSPKWDYANMLDSSKTITKDDFFEMMTYHLGGNPEDYKRYMNNYYVRVNNYAEHHSLNDSRRYEIIKDLVAYNDLQKTMWGFDYSKSNPTGTITRGEAVIILSDMLVLNDNPDFALTPYSDDNAIQLQYRSDINALISDGILARTPGQSFNANNPVTLLEAMHLLTRTFGPYTKNSDLNGKKISGNLTITKPNVVLEDITVNGTLFISPYAHGTIVLNNVSADKLVYYANETNTLQLENSQIGEFAVSNYGAADYYNDAVVISINTNIGNIVLHQSASIAFTVFEQGIVALEKEKRIKETLVKVEQLGTSIRENTIKAAEEDVVYFNYDRRTATITTVGNADIKQNWDAMHHNSLSFRAPVFDSAVLGKTILLELYDVFAENIIRYVQINNLGLPSISMFSYDRGVTPTPVTPGSYTPPQNIVRPTPEDDIIPEYRITTEPSGESHFNTDVDDEPIESSAEEPGPDFGLKKTVIINNLSNVPLDNINVALQSNELSNADLNKLFWLSQTNFPNVPANGSVTLFIILDLQELMDYDDTANATLVVKGSPGGSASLTLTADLEDITWG